MRYGSVCSGIETASIAWEQLGWQAAWFSEIEPFPSAVLAHHWPQVVNLGDMCLLPDMLRLGLIEAPDVLVGGTPCQAFSIAGMREGLDDERGQLTIKYVEVANEIDKQRPAGQECIVVWENVPGVLSSKDNAFGCFLAALVGEDDAIEPSGKKWTNAGVVYGPQRTAAWRILDAQYFGVAQRRRRVFVIASAREGFDPTTVLFEFDGMRRDTPPSREEGQGATGTVAGSSGGDSSLSPFDMQAFGQYGSGRTASTLKQRDYKDATDLVVIDRAAFNQGVNAQYEPYIKEAELSPSLIARGPHAVCTPASAFKIRGGCEGGGKGYLGSEEQAFTVSTRQDQWLHAQSTIRRLTPTECERLQGFPDGHTQIPWRGKPIADCPDGHRYKAIGNSKAVPVIKWIGRRIADAI